MYAYYDEAMNICNDMLNESKNKENSKISHKGRIANFFSQYMSMPNNQNRPINAITYYDINNYLRSREYSDSDKLNIYNSLKKFFKYTYSKGFTPEIISQVTKPLVIRKPKKTIPDIDCEKIKQYIFCKSNNLKDRLLLGFFLFTGLSRQYISHLKISDCVFLNGVYFLTVTKNGQNYKLPIKSEMQLLIAEYRLTLHDLNSDNKLFDLDENYMSTAVTNLTKRITGKKYAPTAFSNTFIALALSQGNYIWEVSNLILESVSNIANHIVYDENELLKKQTSILNGF